MTRYRITKKGRDRLRRAEKLKRWRASRSVSFWDWPGSVHEVAGRRVKIISAIHGYAAVLLDREGRPFAPISTRKPQSLQETLDEVRAFFDKLDSKLES